jgi:hypothetical protein
MELVAFAIVATALHRRLAQVNPDAARPTEFYLILSRVALRFRVRRDHRPNFFPTSGVRSCWSGRRGPRLDLGGARRLQVSVSISVRWSPKPHRGHRISWELALAVALAMTGALATEAGCAGCSSAGWSWPSADGHVPVVTTAFVLTIATSFSSRRPIPGAQLFGVSGAPFDGLERHGSRERHHVSRYPAHRPSSASYADLLRTGGLSLTFDVGATSSAVDTKRIGVVGLGAGV